MPTPILLDRSRPETLTDQLIAQMRSAIRKGVIAPGTRLPSSRKLSEQLAVSRNTVVRAYDALILDLYAESRPASGIIARLPPAISSDRLTGGSIPSRPPVRIEALPKAPNLVAEHRQRLSFDFFPGRPNPALFPLRAWRRYLMAALANGLQELSQYGDPAGHYDLRAAICAHVAATRAIIADPSQVIVLNGGQEGVSLCARLLLSPGRVAIVEAPTAQGVVYAFEAAGAQVVSVPVDKDGLRVDLLPDSGASLVHVSPSHQFPTGCDLAMDRRHALAAWASRTGSYILEDDCSGDLRYAGPWPPALMSVAPDMTLHVGSFSRTLGAGLRLGYLIVPRHLIESLRASKALLNNGTGWLEQAALAAFMASGSYATHLARLRKSYRVARDGLINALERHFGEIDLGGASGGLHMLWRLPPGVPPALIFESLVRRARVGVYSFGSAGVWDTAASLLSRRGVVLGFGSLTSRQIEDGVTRMSDMVDDRLDRHHDFLGEILTPDMEEPAAIAPIFARPAPRLGRELALHGARQRKPLSRHHGNRKDVAMFVAGIYRYPVKGLSPQPMRGVDLMEGRPFPFDRVFALARYNSAIDVANPKWAKKALFLMLMLEETLAKAQTFLDDQTLEMTVVLNGRTTVIPSLDTAEGRAAAEELFGALANPNGPTPALVRSADGHFMDKPDNVLSLINLATIRDLEERWGMSLDPLRFRANFYVDGVAPWAEFEWVGRDLRIGDAQFVVDRVNGRCGATNVNPRTGARDRDIPAMLRTSFGHKNLGVYLVVKSAGRVVVGDPVGIVDVIPSNQEPAQTFAMPGARSHICRGCYYIYDEAAGAPRHSAAPGTSFAALPVDWPCPDCGTDKSKFRPYTDPLVAEPA